MVVGGFSRRMFPLRSQLHLIAMEEVKHYTCHMQYSWVTT